MLVLAYKQNRLKGIEISYKKFPNHKFLYFQVRQKLRLNISDEKGSI